MKMAAPMDSPSVIEIDNFKDIYKRYKRRDRQLNVTGVVDLCSTLKYTDTVEPYQLNTDNLPKFPGLKPVQEWKAYQLKNCKGFVVIKNPFEPRYQRYWVERCLLDFPTKPNTINLDAHMERPTQIWQNCITNGRPDIRKESLLMKLRWATLGYQYEWNTKEYFADRRQEFPSDLSLLCSHVAAALGYGHFSSEAGIVNYYRMDSTLMGHTDVSELDKAAPLISFSFGQSCIFLIGGPTKATEPIPVFLHSGDICLMTGPARLSFHAVPRIVHANQAYFQSCFHTDSNGVAKSENSDNGVAGVEHNCNSEKNGIKMDGSGDNYQPDDKENVSSATETEDDPYSDPANRKHFKPFNQSEVRENIDYSNEIEATPTVKGDNCTTGELQELMDTVIERSDWDLFEDYLKITRVNVNVRQVLKAGCSLKNRPDTIVPLSCPGTQNK